MNFLVELVWTDGKQPDDKQPDGKQNDTASIYLTADGRVLLRGRSVPDEERAQLGLPAGAAVVSVDRQLIKAIKEML